MKKKIIRLVKAAAYGLVGTGAGMMLAEADRGYFAIGGEILIIPICLLLVGVVPELASEMREIAQEIKGKK